MIRSTLPAIVLAVVGAAGALAQQASPTPQPTLDEAIAAFAIKPPDESSPFFADRELAQFERRAAARRDMLGATGPNDTAIYPSANTPNSAAAVLKNFFTSMFASIKIGSLRGQPVTSRLVADPSSFSLAERREFEVTYTVRNNTRKIMRLDYPTTQRIEILTMDGAGKVLDRWSDDRAFTGEEGVVFINPNERIQYSEKLPTRDMVAGETYTVTAEAAGNPDYSAGAQVEPLP